MASDFLNIELCTSNKNYVIGLCGFSEWVKCLVLATQWTINISCQYSKTFVFSNASGSEISLILSYHISDLFVSFRDDHGAWAMCIRIIFYCVRDRGKEESSSGLWQIIFCEPGVCSHYSSFVQSPAQSLLQLCEVMFEAWGDGQLGPHPGNYSLHRDRLYFFTYFSPIAIHSTKKKRWLMGWTYNLIFCLERRGFFVVSLSWTFCTFKEDCFMSLLSYILCL